MGKIIKVSKEEMRLMSSLDKGISFMRSKDNPMFNRAIDKQKSLRKEILKDIIEKAA